MSDLNDLVRHNASNELALTMIDESIDVAAEVANNAYGLLSEVVGEFVACLPVGSVVKAIGNALITYNACRFFRKLGKFMSDVKENFSEEKTDAFLDSIADCDEEVSEYMLSILDKAESKVKAKMLGIIYATAARRTIGLDTMLRLSSIAVQGFIVDFRRLSEFTEPQDNVSDASNSFVNLGLIDNEPGGVWRNQPEIKLNLIGNTLLAVLTPLTGSTSSVKRISKSSSLDNSDKYQFIQ